MKIGNLIAFMTMSLFGVCQNDIVHLNINEALQCYPPFLAVKDSLETRQASINDSITFLESQFENRISTINCGRSKTYYTSLESELVSIQQEIDSLKAYIVNDVDAMAKKLVQEDVNELINLFAAQNDFLMVLDESKVFIILNGRDVTYQFVEYINKTTSTTKK